MHGGTIRVESTVDVGSTFTVSLPFGSRHLSNGRVITDGVTPIALQGSAVAYVQEALAWLPGQNRLTGEVTAAGDGPQSSASPDPTEHKPVILVVDDNADMRNYVMALLGWRFEVVLAENGMQALHKLARVRPDLVLTDVMMPEMDGLALLSSLRRNPVTRAIPVIMLSARAGEEARIEGIDAGADDYLSKPFSARELVARVEAQLKLAKLRKDAVEQEAALNHELNKVKQFAWEALEHIPEVFYTFDEDFRFTYMNAAGAEIEARLGKPILGQVLWDVLPELKGTAVETNFRSALNERIPIEFDYYYEPLEDWFQYHVYPLPDGGISMYARNTTGARQTEQALRRSEQLAAAGRLAASVAHEINNPLEAVTNVLYLAMMDQIMSQKTRSLLELADKELQRLSHIAARSLKFYRQRTAPAPSSLEELIESVLFFHEREINTRDIHLQRKYRKTPQVLCHPGEIQQVITNLIRNALDALAPHGRLIVAVRPGNDPSGRAGVAMTVADNAVGMDATILDRLFHPFVTTKGEAGTGLGLWVSKGILDKHHATVAVRSKRGCGTVFRIFLPLDTTVGEPQSA